MSQWTPSCRAARFIANCMLRGHRNGQIVLPAGGEQACVDTCLSRILAPNLRRKAGVLWRAYGSELVNIARRYNQDAYAPDRDTVHQEVMRALCA